MIRLLFILLCILLLFYNNKNKEGLKNKKKYKNKKKLQSLFIYPHKPGNSDAEIFKRQREEDIQQNNRNNRNNK
jgi:hypothetical protein